MEKKYLKNEKTMLLARDPQNMSFVFSSAFGSQNHA